jgi:hypothetical protein
MANNGGDIGNNYQPSSSLIENIEELRAELFPAPVNYFEQP